MGDSGDNATAKTCSLCAVIVTDEELRAGAAVRIGEDVICPSCIDQLPADAQVRINQIRAVRGMASTTYKFHWDRHPDLSLYTFSTAAQMMHIRRQVGTGTTIDTPLIGQRDAVPTTASRATTSTKTPTAMIVGAAVIGVLLAAIAAIAFSGGDSPPASPPEATNPTQVAPDPEPVAQATRESFPAAPRRAWIAASRTLSTGDPVLQQIADELIAAKRIQLDKARRALERGDLIIAADHLSVMALPDHPLLADIRRTEEGLRLRIRNLKEQASIKQDEPDTAAPRPAPDPIAPIPAPPKPTGPSWISHASALLDPHRPDPAWDNTAGGGLQLIGPHGAIERRLVLPAGSYQLFVRLRAVPDQGWLRLSLGPTSCRFEEPPVAVPGWHLVPGPTITITEAGDHAFSLAADGAGWHLSNIHIVAADHVTRPASTSAEDLKLVATEAPVVVEEPDLAKQPPPPPPVVVHAFAPDADLQDAKALSTTDQRFTSLWDAPPEGSGPTVWESVKKHRRLGWQPQEKRGRGSHYLHGVLLRGPVTDCSAGGIAVSIHPLHPKRKTLRIWVIDADGDAWQVDGNPRSRSLSWTLEQHWQTLVIDAIAPPADRQGKAHACDPTRISAIALTDEEDTDATTRFLVGRAAAVARRAPTNDDIGIEPQAMLPLDDDDLEKQVRRLLKPRGRPATSWYSWFEPRRLRFLHGHQLFTGAHIADLRRAWTKTLGGGRLANGTTEKIILQDLWLDGEFLIEPELLEADHNHVVMVATGGAEFMVGLTAEQAQHNFWYKMIDECLDRGVLPIVVLGPNKTDPRHWPAANHLWSTLARELPRRNPGIPIIDCRDVPTHGASRFGTGGPARIIGRLDTAVTELLTRLDHLAAAQQARQ